MCFAFSQIPCNHAAQRLVFGAYNVGQMEIETCQVALAQRGLDRQQQAMPGAPQQQRPALVGQISSITVTAGARCPEASCIVALEQARSHEAADQCLDRGASQYQKGDEVINRRMFEHVHCAQDEARQLAEGMGLSNHDGALERDQRQVDTFEE
jgi:hypothetical protein